MKQYWRNDRIFVHIEKGKPTFPAFHLISVDLETGSPLSFTLNSLERALFSKYGFSSKYYRKRNICVTSVQAYAMTFTMCTYKVSLITHKIYSISRLDILELGDLHPWQVMKCFLVLLPQKSWNYSTHHIHRLDRFQVCLWETVISKAGSRG